MPSSADNETYTKTHGLGQGRQFLNMTHNLRLLVCLLFTVHIKLAMLYSTFKSISNWSLFITGEPIYRPQHKEEGYNANAQQLSPAGAA